MTKETKKKVLEMDDNKGVNNLNNDNTVAK